MFSVSELFVPNVSMNRDPNAIKYLMFERSFLGKYVTLPSRWDFLNMKFRIWNLLTISSVLYQLYPVLPRIFWNLLSLTHLLRWHKIFALWFEDIHFYIHLFIFHLTSSSELVWLKLRLTLCTKKQPILALSN